MIVPNSSHDIAIVGMSALFPGAKDLRTYWQNILNQVNAVGDAPDKWAKPYFDPDSTANDRIYTRKGGFLGDLAEFNPLEFGIMPSSVDGGEPDHFLALKLAWEALQDAGYIDRPFNREKTGIILGRGTYINRGYNTLLQHGQIVDQTLDLLRQLHPDLDENTLNEIRKQLKASLPPFTAEMAPGLVPNVITGRIANRLNLMGPNYIIDAACASSLIAVELAMKELLSDRCDMVLAGGVHASTPPQINMIFCQLGALSRSDIKPFDSKASGTLLGEGLGIVVLKRLRDAEKDGDRIYAVLKGVGSSSDGKALGLLAPRLEGEVLALQRAYQESGIDPTTVGMIEAHGTGIALGDQTEVRSLTQIFGQRQEQLPKCALGSVKSMIGHCIPAAGAAGLIKTALALYHKILPPTLCDEVNPGLEIEKTPFYINTQARPWIHGDRSTPRRAGVNSFGFGGINAHAVLEEYPTQPLQSSAWGLSPRLLHQQWPTELLLFSGDSRSVLIERIHQVQQVLQNHPQAWGLSPRLLAEIAYTLSTHSVGSHRLAVVAKDISELQKKLSQAVEKLHNSPKSRLQTRNGIYYAEVDTNVNPGKTAFIFPGEGSQYPQMLADLCLYFPQVREWFDFLDATFSERRAYLPSQLIFPPPTSLTETERHHAQRRLFDMDVASETVFTASMALYELLCNLGVKCDVMVGHSTGENAALIASGTVRLSDRMELMSKMRLLNQIYLDLEVAKNIPKGALLTVGAIAPEVLQQVLDEFDGRLHVAMDNCPNQVVLFGSVNDIDAATGKLQAVGGICTRLPFDRAYHTSLFAPVGNAFLAFYNDLDVGSGHTPLYSCATAAPFPQEPQAIRALAAQQWSSRVRFRETVLQLYQSGVKNFIEVGPSSNLTAFVSDILYGREHQAIASNSQRQSGLEQIQHLLARLFVNGNPVDTSALYLHRQITPVSLDTTTQVGEIQKSSPVLELTMPVLRLQPDFVNTVRGKLQASKDVSVSHATAIASTSPNPPVVKRPEPVAKDSSSTIPVVATVVSTNVNDTVAITTPVRNSVVKDSISDENIVTFSTSKTYANAGEDQSYTDEEQRLSIIFDHFDLMQEFLDSQARVMTALHSHLASVDTGVIAPFVNMSLALPEANDWQPSTFDETFPLLGEILEHDAQHLYCQRRFDMQRDIFLYDHTIGGQVSQRHLDLFPLPVIPFTVSMETLAEAAVYLVGQDKLVVGLYDLRGYRWLALDRGELTLKIKARLQSQPDAQTWEVKVQLFQVGQGSTIDHLVFEGNVRLAKQFPVSPLPLPFHLETPAPSRWSDADLYRTGMFHGPRFQGVRHIRQWGLQGIEADLEAIAIEDFFSNTQQPIFQIDAGLLDAAGQLVGYWVSEQFGTDFNVFPFQVRAFHQYISPLPPNSAVLCRGLMRFTSEWQTEASFDFLDATGRVIARLEGWQDRYFSVPHRYYQCRLHPQTAYLSDAWLQASWDLSPRLQMVVRRIEPFPEHFLDDSWSIWKRVLAHLMLNESERLFWYNLPEKGTERTDWLIGCIAAKDAVRQWAKQNFNLELAPIDIEVISTTTGKPVVRCPELEAMAGVLPEIAISHSQGFVVAAMAHPGKSIGIDLEHFDSVCVEGLVATAFSESELQQMPQRHQSSITGLWSAKKAVAQALGTGLQGNLTQLLITHVSSDGQWVTINYGNESFVVQLCYSDREVLAICQHS
ncbi:6-deoxyerythronolide-B synthase [Fischerella thermalis BR2B]|uniref:type I polyketide synthase n=1 Tax=Fischerella thermalis TaxID=372787 RepID=UPI0003146FAD|nr:type I polyketide synthase [Fischerella thermalis]PMB29044.1 6-deoxyerythronolide-B synthase [Fischerella thermalis BR2B]